MKLLKSVSLLAVAVGALGLVVTSSQGCGSSSSGGGDTSGGGMAGKVPPAAPAGAPASDTPERTFAVNQLFLGETDRKGNPVKDAWKDYGFNIDGLITA